MMDKIVCDRCGKVYDNVPMKDYNDGSWYCTCSGSLEIEKDATVTCECCGYIVDRSDAQIGDYGEYFCPECYETYRSELEAEIKATCASLRCAS